MGRRDQKDKENRNNSNQKRCVNSKAVNDMVNIGMNKKHYKQKKRNDNMYYSVPM